MGCALLTGRNIHVVGLGLSATNAAGKDVDLGGPDVFCPRVVDKTNWVGIRWHNNKDKIKKEEVGNSFAITQIGQNIKAVRKDTGNDRQHWGMDLRFKCCTGEPKTATVGPNWVSRKCGDVATCNAATHFAKDAATECWDCANDGAECCVPKTCANTDGKGAKATCGAGMVLKVPLPVCVDGDATAQRGLPRGRTCAGWGAAQYPEAKAAGVADCHASMNKYNLDWDLHDGKPFTAQEMTQIQSVCAKTCGTCATSSPCTNCENDGAECCQGC